jgi:hypothetical protein
MRLSAVSGLVVAMAMGATPGLAQIQGPSSSHTPYVLPSANGWITASIISAGDRSSDGRYAMVGIPDGLGALPGRYDGNTLVDDPAYITVFMNHEIPAGNGIPRAHGQNGAFVSQWTIHLNSLQVQRGEDLIREVYTWDIANRAYVRSTATALAQFNRFCSADLPPLTAFFNPATGRGFDGRIYMNGEEVTDGRAFGHVLTGELKGYSVELPYLGRFAWENSVPHPNAGDRTIVVGLDDSTRGQVYIYAGDKKATGTPIERAGLTGGSLFGIRVINGGGNYNNGHVVREDNGPINGRFELVNVSDVAVGPDAVLQAGSVARGITDFARPEDGAWDPTNPDVFYFVVTGAVIGGRGQSARLYRLTFDANGLGGTIEMVIDRASLLPSSPLFAQFDNLTITSNGFIVIQEDPGNTPYLAQTWIVNPATRTATSILQSDAARFAPAIAPFNADEESSGIIEVTDLVRAASWFDPARRYFLADIQAHYSIPGELYEGGQLYFIASPRQ